ncbi:histidine kinase [Dysosmobacter sp. Sow4_B12]|uniref:sensor histidine kinase n=1 Tax=Dysosmobacter sp. Sow4_B12 TaxID=3438777 RepID=UPI003F90D6DE
MKKLLQKWRDVSIKTKSSILVGIMIASMWALVAYEMMQFRDFSRKSDVIMNDYIEITGFMDAFSEENVWLEAYIRPALDVDRNYRLAGEETDRRMELLRPDLAADRREEYVLKRAICNAMEHYRETQVVFLNTGRSGDAFIQRYFSLKSQAAYIDGYTRELLNSCMERGGEQWQEIETANNLNSRRFSGFLVGATVLMIVILLILTRSVLRPLEDLGGAADHISAGRYDAPPLEVRGNDELGRAARSFNLMQTEIRRTIHALEKQAEMEKSLLEKEVEAAQMQHKLQEGRFAQLQSQINPHFLFNTLSTIAALAREEGAPLSEDLVLRLSSFFRYSLESDEKVVPLGREIQLLRDYMELQETRYGDRITMEVRSDPALEDVPVPKFILQPLVENAILHGLRQCTEGGCIRVRSRRDRTGNIVITVTDNGCGFDTSRLGAAAAGERRSVGLKNIAERMEYSGGRLDVCSVPGVGTCARITVGGGTDHDQDPGGRG